ncbi:MAG: hypothetical protein WD342_01040 [Verrucomicrobiales bacterium]
MKSPFYLLAASVLLLTGTACVRTSTVVKVDKEGAGSVIARYHFSPEMLAMVDQLGALGGIQGAAPQGPNLAMIGEMAKPDEESLAADASNYGEGVRYAKHELGKDDDGWEGYTVVYEFDDIRQVRIDQNSVPGKAKEFVESSGEKLDAEEGSRITFDLKDDTLEIHTNIAGAGVNQMIDEEQLAQARNMGMKPSEALKMAAGMTRGMRVGFFVRIDGEIAETNAEHVSGNLIILSDADVSQVMQDPDFAEFIDQTVENPEAVTEEAVKELYDDLEAMTIEMSEKVTVKFK